MSQRKPVSKIRSDQVERLKHTTSNKRVAVFIDAANLYYASTKAGIRMSFETLFAWFTKNSAHADLYFYTAFDPEGKDQLEFLETLSKIGFVVVKKPIKVFETLTKGNMDIELAVDTLTKLDSYDVMVLMSGDGDFAYLVNYLKSIGKTTIMIAIGGYTSFELHEAADQYFFLDRLGRVWQNKLKFNMHQYKIFLDTITETDYNTGPQVIPEDPTEHTSLLPKLEKLKLKLRSKSDNEDTRS